MVMFENNLDLSLNRSVDGETRIDIFATRDIKKGEHLTYDYQFNSVHIKIATVVLLAVDINLVSNLKEDAFCTEISCTPECEKTLQFIGGKPCDSIDSY